MSPQGTPARLASAGPDARRADLRRRSRRRQRIYALCLLLCLLAAAAIYLLPGDLSEHDRNRLTPLWVFPLVFGAYGLVGEELLRLVQAGRAANLAEAARHWNHRGGLVGQVGRVLLLPFTVFRYTRWQSPWLATLLAAVFWSLLLVFLLDWLFPGP